ncbi:MAG: protein-tyrosine kinase [Lachnospiraceae bacterium]|nr:protein-tyrosine kinase [Lachnospiraceae bacterium]
MEFENYKDEIEIDLRELFAVILSRLYIIILVGVLGAILAFTYTKLFIAPQYASTTKVYILSNKEDDRLTTSDLAFASYLALDYQELIVSEPVMMEVIDELNLNMTTKALASHINVQLIENTRIIKITVRDTSATMAKRIADCVRDAVNDKTKDVMGGIEAINPIDEATMPVVPASPNVYKNTAIGFLGGAFIVLLVVVVLFLLDDTIKSQEDIEKYLGLSVLASIPYQKSDDSKSKKNKNKSKKKEKEA